MAVKGLEGTINLSIFFVTTILTTTGSPSVVLNGHCQSMILHHVFTPQFFGYDQIVVIDKCRGLVVEKISTAVHYALSDSCYELALFLIVLRRF